MSSETQSEPHRRVREHQCPTLSSWNTAADVKLSWWRQCSPAVRGSSGEQEDLRADHSNSNSHASWHALLGSPCCTQSSGLLCFWAKRVLMGILVKRLFLHKVGDGPCQQQQVWRYWAKSQWDGCSCKDYLGADLKQSGLVWLGVEGALFWGRSLTTTGDCVAKNEDTGWERRWSGWTCCPHGLCSVLPQLYPCSSSSW